MNNVLTIFRSLFRSRNCYVPILLLCLLAPSSRAQPEDAKNAQAQEQTPVETPEQHIKAIERHRDELEGRRKQINEQLAKADESEADVFKQQLELVDQTLTVLTAQIGQWQRYQELDAQVTADRMQLARIEEDAKSQKAFSFLELDRAREQLAVESARIKVVRGKFDLAKQALEEAKSALKQIDGKANGKHPTSAAKADLFELRREFAEQQKVLRELEVQNEEKAYSSHEALLQLLEKQIKIFRQNTNFDESVLKELLSEIDRAEFQKNRELEQLKRQQIRTQSLLERSRRRLDEVGLEDEKASADIEVRRLELDVVETKIEATERELALLAQRKETWQKRYDIFNERTDQTNLPQWRAAAGEDLNQLQQEQATLKLWLSDWRSRLGSVNSELAYAEGHALVGYRHRQEQIQQTIDTLEQFNAELDSNRKLLQHLIDDISVRNSQHSLRDWLDLIVHMQFRHDPILVWGYAFTLAITIFGFLYLLRWFLIRTLKLAAERQHLSNADELLKTVKRANLVFFLAIALYCASLPLTMAPATEAALGKFIKVVIAVQVAIWLSGFLRAWIFRILVRKTKRDGASLGALSILNFTGQVLLWSLASLLILQNLGVDITALVAGLGIGGIAVALALQRILNDLFSSLSIVLDKPFMVGDFVVLGDFLGTVEHIGIKTTRLRSLTGEQIICANGELLETRIRNFKRMHERRVVFKLGVVYQTTYEQLRRIPGIIKDIIEGVEQTRFDRAHFFQYGDFSLDFEIVYYVLSSDYNVYMDAQQFINLEIYRRFEQAGIEFAYPTQSVLVSNPIST
ncbi:mechanosensitive ion channel domain-containing protein [Methylomonas sp. MgM2]